MSVTLSTDISGTGAIWGNTSINTAEGTLQEKEVFGNVTTFKIDIRGSDALNPVPITTEILSEIMQTHLATDPELKFVTYTINEYAVYNLNEDDITYVFSSDPDPLTQAPLEVYLNVAGDPGDLYEGSWNLTIDTWECSPTTIETTDYLPTHDSNTWDNDGILYSLTSTALDADLAWEDTGLVGNKVGHGQIIASTENHYVSPYTFYVDYSSEAENASWTVNLPALVSGDVGAPAEIDMKYSLRKIESGFYEDSVGGTTEFITSDPGMGVAWISEISNATTINNQEVISDALESVIITSRLQATLYNWSMISEWISGQVNKTLDNYKINFDGYEELFASIDMNIPNNVEELNFKVEIDGDDFIKHKFVDGNPDGSTSDFGDQVIFSSNELEEITISRTYMGSISAMNYITDAAQGETVTFTGHIPNPVSIPITRDYSQYDENDASDFTYSLNIDKIVIEGYTGAPVCIIPEIITGYPVASIADFAFKNSSVEYVKIPQTVVSIGEESFANCANLIKVDFGETEHLDVIAIKAFFQSGLQTIMLPKSIRTIADSAFAQTSSLSSVIIQDGLTTLNDDIFSKSSIRSIYLPNSVSSISPNTFRDSNIVEILGQENSYVQEYSNENKMPFVHSLSPIFFSHNSNVSLGSTGTETNLVSSLSLLPINLSAKVINKSETPWLPTISSGFFYFGEHEFFKFNNSNIFSKNRDIESGKEIDLDIAISTEIEKIHQASTALINDELPSQFALGTFTNTAINNEGYIALSESSGVPNASGSYISSVKYFPIAPSSWPDGDLGFDGNPADITLLFRSRNENEDWGDWLVATDPSLAKQYIQYKIDLVPRAEVSTYEKEISFEKVGFMPYDESLSSNIKITNGGVILLDLNSSGSYVSLPIDLDKNIDTVDKVINYTLMPFLNGTMEVFTQTSDDGITWDLDWLIVNVETPTHINRRFMRYRIDMTAGETQSMIPQSPIVQKITVQSSHEESVLVSPAIKYLSLSGPIPSGTETKNITFLYETKIQADGEIHQISDKLIGQLCQEHISINYPNFMIPNTPIFDAYILKSSLLSPALISLIYQIDGASFLGGQTLEILTETVTTNTLLKVEDNEIICYPARIPKSPVIIMTGEDQPFTQVSFFDRNGSPTLTGTETVNPDEDGYITLPFMNILGQMQDYGLIYYSSGGLLLFPKDNDEGEEGVVYLTDDLYVYPKEPLASELGYVYQDGDDLALYPKIPLSSIVLRDQFGNAINYEFDPINNTIRTTVVTEGLTLEYKVLNSFIVEDIPGGVKIKFFEANLPEDGIISVFYETQEEDDVYEMDHNPLRNASGAGFVYISDEETTPQKISVEVYPDNIPIGENEFSQIIILLEDNYGRGIPNSPIKIQALAGSVGNETLLTDAGGSAITKYYPPSTEVVDTIRVTCLTTNMYKDINIGARIIGSRSNIALTKDKESWSTDTLYIVPQINFWSSKVLVSGNVLSETLSPHPGQPVSLSSTWGNLYKIEEPSGNLGHNQITQISNTIGRIKFYLSINPKAIDTNNPWGTIQTLNEELPESMVSILSASTDIGTSTIESEIPIPIRVLSIYK